MSTLSIATEGYIPLLPLAVATSGYLDSGIPEEETKSGWYRLQLVRQQMQKAETDRNERYAAYHALTYKLKVKCEESIASPQVVEEIVEKQPVGKKRKAKKEIFLVAEKKGAPVYDFGTLPDIKEFASKFNSLEALSFIPQRNEDDFYLRGIIEEVASARIEMLLYQQRYEALVKRERELVEEEDEAIMMMLTMNLV